MNPKIWFLALCFWGLLLAETLQGRILLGLLILFWAWLRFHCWKTVLAWLLLASFACWSIPAEIPVPVSGEYRIEEIHRSYSIAGSVSDPKIRVVVYQARDFAFQDVLELDSFEKARSEHNPGIFAFDNWLEKRGIAWTSRPSSQDAVSRSNCLKARIYRYLKERDDFELSGFLLYGFQIEGTAEWVSRLSLPVIGFLAFLRKLLGRFLDQDVISILIVLLIAAFGFLFQINLPLYRLMVFTGCRVLLRKKRKWQMPASIVSFLILFPWASLEFSFLLPVLLFLTDQAFSHASGWQKKMAGKLILCILQVLAFSQLNFLLLFGYRRIREWFGGLFLAGIFGLCLSGWLPETSQWISGAVCRLLMMDLPGLDFLAFKGHAGWLASALLLYGLFRLLVQPRKKSLLAAGMVLCFYFLSFDLDPFFHVISVDVGQGDCTLIIEPFRKSIVMIDAAGRKNSDLTDRILVPVLDSFHIDHLDRLILTHDDLDHAGSADSLCERIPVSQVIRNRNEKVEVEYPFHSLAVERNVDPDDENDQSIVSYFAYDGFSWLWMGDASTRIEDQLLEEVDIRADIIKLGHHGSKTSSSLRFLKEVKASLAIVSAGAGNRYGHPSVSVLENLSEAGTDVLQTAVQGMIHMKTWRGVMWIQCADGTFAFLRKSDDQ